jgi:GDP-D-mannose dehydratase
MFALMENVTGFRGKYLKKTLLVLLALGYQVG